MGAILLVVPWTGLWESNYLLQPHPALRGLLLSPFMRGGISGLGVINIILAVHEARHHLTRGAAQAATGRGGIHLRRQPPGQRSPEDAEDVGPRG